MKIVGTFLLVLCGLSSLFLLASALLVAFGGLLGAFFDKQQSAPMVLLVATLLAAAFIGALGVFLLKAGMIVRDVCSVKSAIYLLGFFCFSLVGFKSVVQLGLQVAKEEFAGSGQELLGASLVGPGSLVMGALFLGLFFWESRKLVKEMPSQPKELSVE